MTDIDHAIQTLRVMQGKYSHIRHSDAEWQALELAIEVLRDGQRKSEGCRCCIDNDCGLPALEWMYGLDHILPDYQYCPMCGRKIEEEQ